MKSHPALLVTIVSVDRNILIFKLGFSTYFKPDANSSYLAYSFLMYLLGSDGKSSILSFNL